VRRPQRDRGPVSRRQRKQRAALVEPGDFVAALDASVAVAEVLIAEITGQVIAMTALRSEATAVMERTGVSYLAGIGDLLRHASSDAERTRWTALAERMSSERFDLTDKDMTPLLRELGVA